MTKPRRRRSLEVTCLFKVRDANREHDRAMRTFNAAPDRARITEYLNDVYTAENKVARCRSMRNAASSVAIRRSRHGLMLAAARHGVDAYALLDWETNSPESPLGNLPESNRKRSNVHRMCTEPAELNETARCVFNGKPCIQRTRRN